MTTRDRVAYLDSSALVKLAVREAESDILTQHLRARPRRVSCMLARVEVVRAIRPHGAAAVRRAEALLAAVDLLALDASLLDLAARVEPMTVRSLDAIHLAAATQLGGSVELITYDRHMQAAARAVGLPTSAPA